ncbi:MAG: DNA-binding protein [Bacteroidales bacterium]|nr:DNA-binding protein [Bacteroidales bacterium]
MNRIDFLKLLAVGTLAGVTGWKGKVAAKEPKHVLLFASRVAGFSYYNGASLAPFLKPGTRLVLVREPENPYDWKAIAVFYGSTKIGFLPRSGNLIPCRMMDQGVQLVAEVIEYYSEAHPEERLKINVFMVKEK